MSDITFTTSRIEKAFATYRIAFGFAAIMAIVAGLVILFWPTKALDIIAMVIGVYAIGAGAFYLAMGIFGSKLSTGSKAARVLAGIALLVLGILALVYMDGTRNLLVILISVAVGILWLTEGAVTFMMAIKSKDTSAVTLVFGIIAIAAGVAMLFLPFYESDAILKWMFGISFIALGIAQILHLVRVGKVAKEAASGGVKVVVE